MDVFMCDLCKEIRPIPKYTTAALGIEIEICRICKGKIDGVARSLMVELSPDGIRLPKVPPPSHFIIQEFVSTPMPEEHTALIPAPLAEKDYIARYIVTNIPDGAGEFAILYGSATPVIERNVLAGKLAAKLDIAVAAHTQIVIRVQARTACTFEGHILGEES